MRCHILGKTLLPPAPSTNVAFQSGNTCGEPFAKESAAGAAVSGSAPHALIAGSSAFMALATPVIIAGLRIATVSSIALITIAALIGRGGFGQFILEGLDTFFWTPLVVGVVLSVALAFLADILLLGLQRVMTPWAEAAGVRAVAT